MSLSTASRPPQKTSGESNHKIFPNTWEQVKIAVESLFTTKIGRFIKPGPTLYDQIKSTQHGRLVKQSENYLRKLGLTTFNWSQKGTDIYFQNQKIRSLRNKESKLLSALVAAQGQVVTYDDLEPVI